LAELLLGESVFILFITCVFKTWC